MELEHLFCIYNKEKDVFFAIKWIFIDSRFGVQDTVSTQFEEDAESYKKHGYAKYSLKELFEEFEGKKRTNAITLLFNFIQDYNKETN